MKKITVMTFGLILAATPAFAGEHHNQGQAYTQSSSTTVIQANELNASGDAWGYNSADSAGNGGISNTSVSNSSGIINQNVNSGATSNVGSATNVAITGGASARGGNLDAGNPNDTATQVSGALLEQVNAGNSTGNALCTNSGASAYTAGVANTSVNGSFGIVSQQVNAGVTSNVGSAVGIAIH